VVPDANSPGTALGISLGAAAGPIENGMIWNKPVINVQKPCGGCLITGIQAGLEYADGTDANIDTGLWLHHMVLLASGTGKADATCAYGLPQVAVAHPGAERIFASGNERTPVDLTRTGNFGYRLNSADQLHLLVDLMNMNPTAKTVYLTMQYRYVPGAAAGYRPVRPVWLDAAQCGTSEVKAQTGAYTLTSRPWTSNVSGTLIQGFGHLHDGGTNVTFENNGQQFCDSEARYGTKPGYIEPAGMDHGDGAMDHGHAGGSHISEQTECTPGASLKPGDVLTIKGHYDDAQHAQMMHDGKLHEVMAIGFLYYGQ
jgi:hypothetical protein